MANPAWRNKFPGYKVINGGPCHSDHRPIVLHVRGSKGRVQPNQSKRFEARWLLEEDCDAVVENAWNLTRARGETHVADLVRSVSRELSAWNKDVLGDLQKRIKKLKNELEECRRGISQASINKEQVLRFKLDRLQEQNEIFWKQRAHVQWLEKGDSNTSYFHLCASERKKNGTP